MRSLGVFSIIKFSALSPVCPDGASGPAGLRVMLTVTGRMKPMTKRDILVIGACEGGIGVLKQLVSRLPSRLDAAVLVTGNTLSQ
jgi:chemotaxis response regulator CheB